MQETFENALDSVRWSRTPSHSMTSPKRSTCSVSSGTVYGIARVRRSDYVVMDRHHLAYLNAIEKINCEYCGYANGVFAYVREIAARTEQYWCPIRHARRIPAPHTRYRNFVDYGDAQGYHRRLIFLRRQLPHDRGDDQPE